MKKKLLLVLESCAFVALALGLLIGLTNLTERKAGRNQFGPFLKDPQAYDVLFFSDSRLVNAVFPMELWDDYGIASYNLACYGTTLPVTHWSILNALDYASPKVVVLATNGVSNPDKAMSNSSEAHTALDFFPLTRNKARAIEDLMSDPKAVDEDGNRYVDMKWEYYFPLGKYHSRWHELTPEDWKGGTPGVQNGAEIMVDVAYEEPYEIIEEDLYAEQTGVGYIYLRRIIETCQSRGIEVLLVNLPYHPAPEILQRHANTVGSIAEEYGVGYVDFVRLDSVVDYAVDCYDLYAHLNVSGGLKVTDYLGRYMVDHYGLEDRRQDPAYAPWADRREAYMAHKKQLLGEQTELEHALLLLHDFDYDVRVALAPDSPVYFSDTAIMLMHNIPREHVYEESQYAMASSAMYPLAVFDEAIWDNAPYFLSTDGGVTTELAGEEAVMAAQAVFGARAGAGACLQAVDRRTGELVAQMIF